MPHVSLIRLALLGVFLCSAVNAEQPTVDLKQHLKPLEQLVGTWEKKFAILKADGTPEEKVRTGTYVAKWILKDLHLQESGEEEGTAYLNVYSYVFASREFGLSVFKSSGESYQMTGKWDPAAKAFTWTRHLNDGLVSETVYQITGDDDYKFGTVLKDGGGKVLMRTEGTGKRVAAKPQ